MDNSPLQTYLVNVLGCKVNQYDARQIEQLLENHGLKPARTDEPADIVIIHTCGVTAAAAQKSRQTIRRLQRNHPLAQLFVTGCAAETELTHVDQAPVSRVPAGADWLQRLEEQLAQLTLPEQTATGTVDTDTFTISRFGDQTRAFLKVQDGCDIGCSYCIIPRLRKAPRDKPLEAAVREAEVLTQNGYRELVVTGVSVGLYGRDGGPTLADLLRKLVQIPNIGRIRLSSLHPNELTDDLLAIWAESPHIMPHLHLSLQSGSDAVLAAMRRSYSKAEYLDAVIRARAVLDTPAFTTDIIVGFPGETDAHFEECHAFCKEVGFSQMHVFTYSPRPGTMAAKMGNQVNGALATQRSEKLFELGQTMALDYHRQFLDRTISVLVERIRDGVAEGYSEQYVPTRFQTTEALHNQIVQLKINEATVEGISGTISL